MERRSPLRVKAAIDMAIMQADESEEHVSGVYACVWCENVFACCGSTRHVDVREDIVDLIQQKYYHHTLSFPLLFVCC